MEDKYSGSGGGWEEARFKYNDGKLVDMSESVQPISLHTTLLQRQSGLGLVADADSIRENIVDEFSCEGRG